MAWEYSLNLDMWTGDDITLAPTTEIDRDSLAYDYLTGKIYVYNSVAWLEFGV